MTCCGGGKPLPTPGTGRARGFTRGQTLSYQILDSSTDEILLDEHGEPLQFAADTPAYDYWRTHGQVGYVRATWV